MLYYSNKPQSSEKRITKPYIGLCWNYIRMKGANKQNRKNTKYFIIKNTIPSFTC